VFIHQLSREIHDDGSSGSLFGEFAEFQRGLFDSEGVGHGLGSGEEGLAVKLEVIGDFVGLAVADAFGERVPDGLGAHVAGAAYGFGSGVHIGLAVLLFKILR
jgi:hypothetical protein